MSITDVLSQKWFHWVHSKNLIYNTCWEDPRIDRVALELSPFDNLLMITSAGCNALDYALDAPRRIVAVDVNPRQTALLDLKIAAIKNLDFEDFFQLFGKGNHRYIESLYKYQLRKHLPYESQKIWDLSWSYFNPDTFRKGLYFRGSSGLFAWLINRYMEVRKIRNDVFDLFQSSGVASQEELYRKVEKRLWTRRFEFCLNTDVGMSLLGVPRAQRKYIEKKYSGQVSGFVKECLESVFTRIPLKDNYFWWLYVAGEYTPERCPEYLKEENFYKLQKGLVNCIETRTCSVSQYLEKTEHPFSRFVLLDHMDWLADCQPLELAREWRAIARTAVTGSKILFRSGGNEIDFLSKIEIPTIKGTLPLSQALRYDEKLATTLHAQDRVQTYGCFKIAQWNA